MNQLPDPQFIRRLEDLANQADRQDFPTHTGFLTPVEQEQAAGFLKSRKIACLIEGGYPEAERKICIILPPGSSMDRAEIQTILVAIKIKPAAQRQTFHQLNKPLAHRDYLGSLLGLGIRRDQIGDIIVDENQATVLALSGILPLIQLELTTVGSQTVSHEKVSLAEVQQKDRGGSVLRITAASIRFDKIAAAGFQVSRSDMAEWICAGQVQLNWRIENRPDRLLSIGDVISLRGYGRIRLVAEQGKSRKDRHIIELEKY